ncbi:MAG: hypothetical protein J5I94_20140 [Phaeodactylibacter sp.]|nr:hypothetical protein [Phaeodactylibacter sp.]
MRIISILVLLAVFVLAAAGQERGFQLRRVVVFKDGTVFLEKEAEVDAASGTVSLSEYPVEARLSADAVTDVPPSYYDPGYSRNSALPVLFGTVRWSAPGNEVLDVVAGSREEARQVPADNLHRLLQLNVGRKVCIWTKDTKGPNNCGYIVGHSGDGAGNIPGQLLLRDGQILHQFAVQSIQRLEFEADAVYEEEITETMPSLHLNLERAAEKQTLRLAYLQKGMSWFPNYQMVLLGNGKARLSLYANLMNDIEALDKVPVSFAVGIPSFRFGYLEEPLFTRQTVRSFLQDLENAPAEGPVSMVNMITTQRASANRDIWFGTNLVADFEGLMKEDLFFYNRDEVSLPRGGRGLFKILEQEVAYEDLYVVDIQQGRGQAGYGAEDEPRNRAWHALKFRNKADAPLTTGAISFYSAEKEGLSPISQNELGFTPAKGNAVVKMAVAPDILVSGAAREVGRKNNARDNKDLITVEGKVKAVNFKGKKITLQASCRLEGRLLDSDANWETTAFFNQTGAANPISEATWTITLKPGEEREVTYRYEVYEK